jgi:SAM-dependent methyltransferase
MKTAADGYITDVAYIPGFYPNLAPVAIGYVAALNRVRPPAIDAPYRYLELGCGLGRSFTTLAAANPHGEFVGVDVNPEHTAVAARDIAAGGLGNARVITAGFGQLPDDLGEFQFIGMHGVYSWVAQHVRDEILALARRHLAPGGLMLVSYNAMPGWAHLQPIRGILRQYAALRQGDSLQRIRDALGYLVVLRDKHAKYFDDNPRAAAYVDGLLKQDIRYLAHEYLNEHWTSFYFAEVAAAFAGAGLGFVGSLPVFTNFWDLCVRPEFQELFRTTNNRLVTEAHKDFCANTAFRWDIYSREPRPLPDVEARLRDADGFRFHVARKGVTLPFQSNLGIVTSTVQGPLYQTLVGMLAEASLPLSEIVRDGRVVGTPPGDVARAIDAGVAMGLFEVSGGPLPPALGEVPDRVTVPHAFNRAMLAADSLGGRAVALASPVTGTGHTLGDFDAAILHELVERGSEGLAGRVATRLAGSGRSLQREGKPVTDSAEQQRIIEEACRNFMATALPQFVRLGICTPA